MEAPATTRSTAVGGTTASSAARVRDFIAGSKGNDVINARDGERDRVDCAGGVDTVYADPDDRVEATCETVNRSS